MINQQNEELLSTIENEIEAKGITFKLDVDTISEELYMALLSEIEQYIGQFTERTVQYAGSWEVTVRVKDIELA